MLENICNFITHVKFQRCNITHCNLRILKRHGTEHLGLTPQPLLHLILINSLTLLPVGGKDFIT